MLLAFAGIVLLSLRRWVLLGAYPPGLDGGQWLALGRGWHGYGRVTDGAYAPLIPLLATTLDALFGPLPAIRLVAVLSGLALSLAVWLAATAVVGPFWALPVAAIVIPASALAEPQFYGGYPQQLAFAAGIAALWATGRYLSGQRERDFWLVGVLALFAALAHHLYFPLMIVTIGVAAAFWFSTVNLHLGFWRLRALMLVLLPSIAVFAVVASRFLDSGYTAPLEASARPAVEAWQYATREAPAVWTLVLVAAIASLIATRRSREDAAWIIPASLILPTGLLALFSGQPRLMPPLIVGAGLAAGLGARRLSQANTSSRPALALIAIAFAMFLAVPADRASISFAHYYRVLDPSLVHAADAVIADGAAGTIAVRHDRRGWPIGWWFEALLVRPVIVGSGRQWLAFPDERDSARLADALFDGRLDAPSFQAIAEAENIRYLIMPKWDWIGWERWLNDPEFPVAVIFDDDRYLVLRVI